MTSRSRKCQLRSRNGDSSKNYVYQPLDESNDEIRLITLLPAAERDSEVICDIDIVRLTEEDVPRFEALSYAWGSTESSARLLVSSSNGHSIDITTNLAEVLLYLRDPGLPKVLWIDAIAINQKDLDERGQQVQRMADIFSLAERVVVWLGKDDVSSKTVMETCEFLYTKVEFDYEGYGSLRSLSDHPYDAHWGDTREQLPYDMTTWQAILNFLQRPWFQRLWIWQEIRLAKPNAIMMSGTDTMPWKQLQTLLSCIVYKSSPIPSGIRGSEDARTCVMNGYHLASATSPTLLTLLRRMRHSQCIDPRDRVYGILGLSSKMDTRLDLRPDYKKAVMHVYTDLMMNHIRNSDRLDLLRLCEYDEVVGNWPSWIPDLTQLKEDSDIISRASGTSACEVILLRDRVLRVAGIRLGRITSVDSSNASYQDCNAKIRRWAKVLDMTSDYVDGTPMAEAFCLSICGGTAADRFVPPFRTFPSSESTLAFLHDIVMLENNEVVTYQGERVVSGRVSSVCGQRAFIRTSSHHLGIGPLDAREGDQVCVLLGCAVPMVIRADPHGRYKIVGESYISGLGNNEAFLGPLPSEFKEVLRYDAKSGHNYWVFLQSESGKFQIMDPRLGTELPSGWRQRTDTKGQFWQEFSHESAPDTWKKHDPRLTKSELLKRGVPMEDIEFS